MSKYSNLSPCPFCGHDVVKKYWGGAVVFQCRHESCGVTICFGDDFHTGHPDEAVRAYNTRANCGTFTYILTGAALALIAIVLTCMLFVTLRAENVSHETSAPQETTQQAADVRARAADDGRLAGDDTEAAGYASDLFTSADAIALARMAWGESRGVKELTISGRTISSECQKAAAMWCALNRYDAGYAESIAEVVAAPAQFHGYSSEHPVDMELLELAYDVLDRWQEEQRGAADVGRVLPAEYLFFVGDGENNHFTAEYGSRDYYAWELPDVYGEDHR